MSNTTTTRTLAELMARYNEARAKFEARFGAEFDEAKFHAWMTRQAMASTTEVR